MVSYRPTTLSLMVFTQVLHPRRYERKQIKSRRFCSNAVTLIQNFRYKWSPPPIIFARLVRPYNFAIDSFHTKNFVADFLQAKCDFTRKSAVLLFWDRLWGT